jgi:ribosomal protein S18 acetylase RimI-like enzyme
MTNVTADAAAPFPPTAGTLAGLIVPANPTTTVRAVTFADESFLRALFADERGAEFRSMGLSEAMVAVMLDQQFRAQRAGYRQTSPQAEYLLIEHAAAPVGRLTVVALAHGSGSALHILDVAVLTVARRRGIGTDVLTSLERAARKIGTAQLALSVLHTNEHAIRLYDRLGFVATERGLQITMVKRLA